MGVGSKSALFAEPHPRPKYLPGGYNWKTTCALKELPVRLRKTERAGLGRGSQEREWEEMEKSVLELFTCRGECRFLIKKIEPSEIWAEKHSAGRP